MSLVENLVNQISTNGAGGITKPQGFDLSDDTFEKLLQKAGYNLNAQNLSETQSIGNLGMPAGMIIEPLDGTEPVQAINTLDFYKPGQTEPIEIKDVDMGKDYFSDLLKNNPDKHSSIMDVAKKHASLAYNVFGKNLVEDLGDLAKDITSML